MTILAAGYCQVFSPEKEQWMNNSGFLWIGISRSAGDGIQSPVCFSPPGDGMKEKVHNPGVYLTAHPEMSRYHQNPASATVMRRIRCQDQHHNYTYEYIVIKIYAELSGISFHLGHNPPSCLGQTERSLLGHSPSFLREHPDTSMPFQCTRASVTFLRAS